MKLLRQKVERTPEPAQAEAADRDHPVEIGEPGICPVCGGFGFIDHIDIKNKFQTQHCRECFHSWEYDFDERGVVIDLRDGAKFLDSSRAVRSDS